MINIEQNLHDDLKFAAKAIGLAILTLVIIFGILAILNGATIYHLIKLVAEGEMLFFLLFSIASSFGIADYLSWQSAITLVKTIYRCIRRPIPASHWPHPFNLLPYLSNITNTNHQHLRNIWLSILPHLGISGKTPFLLFQQAPLLLAP